MWSIFDILGTVKYDGELSPSAFIILIVMVVIIIGGLSWCLSRAIKAASDQGNQDEQHPDEI